MLMLHSVGRAAIEAGGKHIIWKAFISALFFDH